MSGEGLIADRPAGFGREALLGREQVASVLEARAAAVVAQFADDRLQLHSRKLPTEAEQAQAAFTARTLQVLAQEFRTGLHDDGPIPREKTDA